MDAVEVFKLKNPIKPNVQPSKSLPPQASASQKNAEDPKFISTADLSDVTMADESIVCCPDEHTGHEPPDPAVNEESLQQNKQELPTADEVSVNHQESLSLSEYLDQIQDLDEGIRRSLLQKRDLLLKLGQLPEEDFDFTLDLPPLPAKNSDPKDVLLTMVTKSNCLAQHVDSLLMSEEPVTDSEVILDEDPPPLPPRNPIVSPTEALPPPLPPRLYRALPKLPISQLMDYCAWMNSHLSYLVRSFAKVEEEKSQLMGRLRIAQEEFKLLLDEHESEDSHLNEHASIDPPNSLTRETEFFVEACPAQEEFIIQANDYEIKDELFFEPVLSDTEHVEKSLSYLALEKFNLKENVTETEDDHTIESVSTDPQNSSISETKTVDSSANQEFALQQYSEGQDCEIEISERDDRDAKPDSNDDCEVGVDFSITVQNIASVEDIDEAQDAEDSVTVVAETQFNDCVIDSKDCSGSAQHNNSEALDLLLDNLEDFST